MIELRLEVDKGREALAERFFDAGQRLLSSLDSLADTSNNQILWMGGARSLLNNPSASPPR
ncbi:hypothetical protein SAMN06266982_104152 [Propioniciclava tarda]|nr:hypothetical protein SAMN06266982_104152 [Propioniciclava tarda]